MQSDKTTNYSEIPEIARLQAAVKAELEQLPHFRDHLIEVQTRLLFVKQAIADIISEIDLEAVANGGYRSSANCHGITFQMEESGNYSYLCETYDLVVQTGDEQEYLTEMGKEVVSRLKARGITRAIFVYSELPF